MKRDIITLHEGERPQLQAMVKKGKTAARMRLHTQSLLHVNTESAAWTNKVISKALTVHPATLANVRQRFVEEDFGAALHQRRTRSSRCKLGGNQETHLIALACSKPPDGQAR